MSTPCDASARPARVSEHHSTRPIVREILGNAQTLLAFLCLINCDVIVARNVLDEHDAGLYAGGLILTKAMLFLPQFVVVVAFPAMSTATERRQALLRGLALILGLGVGRGPGLRGAPRARPGLRGRLASTPRSRTSCGSSPSSAPCCRCCSCSIYAVLARQGTQSVYLVWVALAVLLAVGSQASTVLGLLLVVTDRRRRAVPGCCWPSACTASACR